MIDALPKELFIDVSEDEAPKPFEEATRLISQMNSGEYIRMLHRKKPFPLLQMLQETDFDYKIREGQSTAWEIIIWNKQDSLVNKYCTSTF